jgi:hypothetical protein
MNQNRSVFAVQAIGLYHLLVPTSSILATHPIAPLQPAYNRALLGGIGFIAPLLAAESRGAENQPATSGG